MHSCLTVQTYVLPLPSWEDFSVCRRIPEERRAGEGCTGEWRCHPWPLNASVAPVQGCQSRSNGHTEEGGEKTGKKETAQVLSSCLSWAASPVHTPGECTPGLTLLLYTYMCVCVKKGTNLLHVPTLPGVRKICHLTVSIELGAEREPVAILSWGHSRAAKLHITS